MLVRDLMSAPVEALEANTTCGAAAALFAERHLRRAPVVRDGKVIGMLTDRDIARILPGNIASLDAGEDHPAFKRHVGSLLTRPLVSVGPNDHIEQAAALMLRAKIGGVPVVEGHKAVGILTESDIFKLFVRRGLTQRGHRLVLRAPATAFQRLDPAAIAVEKQARVFDLAIFPMERNRISVSCRVKTPHIQELIDAFITNGYELVLVEET